MCKKFWGDLFDFMSVVLVSREIVVTHMVAKSKLVNSYDLQLSLYSVLNNIDQQGFFKCYTYSYTGHQDFPRSIEGH